MRSQSPDQPLGSRLRASLSWVHRIHVAHVAGLLLLVAPRGVCDEQPVVVGYDPNRSLTWSGSYSNRILGIEASTNLQTGPWVPVSYDLASSWLPVRLYIAGLGFTNVNYGSGTNTVHASPLPGSAKAITFYRVALQTNPPDPTLVLHLPFDNAFSNGVILDISGFNNHALRYSPTNWPIPTTGPDGGQAGEFHTRPCTTCQGSTAQGDYAGIPAAPSLDDLTNGTVLAWAHLDAGSTHNSSILDASSFGNERATWLLGRSYSYDTRFSIGVANGGNSYWDALIFPDTINPFANWDTGGWHYYAVTWDGTNIIGYFDGWSFKTNSQAGFPKLRIGANQWISVGCKIHQGTPQWGDDAMPNWGWMSGQIDDVRIYNRALAPGEISALFARVDKSTPTTPGNLYVRPAGATRMELRWDASYDNFLVAGYRVIRDGVAVGTNSVAACYIDAALSPNTSYSYTVQAFDPAGNLSPASGTATTNTPLMGAPVDVIVDDADGPAFVSIDGKWNLRSDIPGFWRKSFYSRSSLNPTNVGTVSFTPNLPEAGDYEVFLWYPGSKQAAPYMATNAAIDIVASGATNTVRVNEQKNYATWNSLGIYRFSAEGRESVIVHDLADAVRFIK
jgi:hypothetical protein